MFRYLSTLDSRSIQYQRQRQAIIMRCLPLADHIARRFDDRGEAHDDLVQVARMGLVHAVDRFDVGFSSPFLAFAVPTIMGEVRRYFRDHGWSVQVPRRMKDLEPQINRAREELSQELLRAPTATEIAGHLGIERDEVVQALIASSAYSTVPYDTPRRAATDGSPHSVSERIGVDDDALAKVVNVEAVRPLIAALPDRQKMMLLLRFFEYKTQSQIAEQLGISQMQVSRLLAQSLATLREQIEAPSRLAIAGPGRPIPKKPREARQRLAMHEQSA
jgi:RNA polymerase sigma-B factor